MHPSEVTQSGDDMFQSRNRGSFEFKYGTAANEIAQQHQQLFQSRNRGSFEFKGKQT